MMKNILNIYIYPHGPIDTASYLEKIATLGNVPPPQIHSKKYRSIPSFLVSVQDNGRVHCSYFDYDFGCY